MQTNSTTYRDQLEEGAASLGEKLSDTGAQVKEKVTGFGRSAAGMIDGKRDATASGLEKAATSIRENAESLPGGPNVSGMAQNAAETLSTTANYVRSHDVNRMMSDVETMVKNNPGPSILIAAVIGFLAGRAFASND